MADKSRTIQITVPAEFAHQLRGQSNAQLEELVKSILGSQVGRGIDAVEVNSAGNVEYTSEKTKGLWTRACG